MTEIEEKKVPWYDRWFDKLLRKIVLYFGVTLIFAGFLLLLFQIFVYLYSGEWNSFPFMSLAMFAPDKFLMWLAYPKSWLGLHKIISWILKIIPMSVFLMLLGFSFVSMPNDTEKHPLDD